MRNVGFNALTDLVTGFTKPFIRSFINHLNAFIVLNRDQPEAKYDGSNFEADLGDGNRVNVSVTKRSCEFKEVLRVPRKINGEIEWQINIKPSNGDRYLNLGDASNGVESMDLCFTGTDQPSHIKASAFPEGHQMQNDSYRFNSATIYGKYQGQNQRIDCSQIIKSEHNISRILKLNHIEFDPDEKAATDT